MASIQPRAVLLYEINEVPWRVVDWYVERHPGSTLAKVLGNSLTRTTINEDHVLLNPWRTWPSFHRSMYSDDHHSLDLGQDPATFGGEAIWDVAAEAGRTVGVFGSLQSWPPKEYDTGGFYIPDTFARDASTVPKECERFQAFNLKMTGENNFSSDHSLDPRTVTVAGIDLIRRGLTARSAVGLGQHLVKEKRDRRYKARRSSMQALPTFDMFVKLFRQHRPDLSTFFTNHVASSMHRYWGDAFEDYASTNDYQPDPVFATFVDSSMKIFDGHMARLLKLQQRFPDLVIVAASSMGQAPIDYHETRETFMLEDSDRLVAKLGFRDTQPGMAMYPRSSIQFPSPDAAAAGVVVHEEVAGDVVVRLVVDDGREGLSPGRSRFVIEFSDAAGRPVDVRDVRVSSSMTMPGMVMTAPVSVEPVGQGRVGATAEFSMSGAWRFTVEWTGSTGAKSVAFDGDVR